MLVDALVGLGVIVITLTLASQAVQDGLHRVRRQEAVRLAQLEAQSRLAELGADIRLAPGRLEGRDGPLDWTLEVSPTGFGPRTLEVRVQVSDSEGRPLASLRTLKSLDQ